MSTTTGTVPEKSAAAPKDGNTECKQTFSHNAKNDKELLGGDQGPTAGSTRAPMSKAAQMVWYSTCRQKTPEKDLTTLAELIEVVRGDEFKELVAAIRAEANEDERAEMKKRLPAVLISGAEAEGRKVTKHSGLMQIDIDDIEGETPEALRDLAEYDPHIAAAFVSPSGDGLKIIMAIPPSIARHAQAFEAASNYIEKQYGHKPDPVCKDLTRLCFVSHDLAAWCKNAEPLDVEEWLPEEKPAGTAPLPPPEKEEQEASDYHDNDAGRAARFCDRWQGEILYIPERKAWLTWEGRWKYDNNGGIKRRAIQMANEIISEVAAMAANTKEEVAQKIAMMKRANVWGDNRTICAMLSLAGAREEIQCSVHKLDADPLLLGTPNAIIDLRTGEAFSHTPEKIVTKITRAEYDPNATAPRWLQFLEEVFPDAELHRWVWKAVGYSITGDMGEEVFFVPHNSGRNGKSKFINAISWTLGDYAGTAGTAIVAADGRGGDGKVEKAALVGLRFLRAPEADDRQKMNIRLIKDITGGDPLNARGLYEMPFTFNPTCKLWWPVNDRPSVHEVGPAIWERLYLIPFERYFEPHERDEQLEGKLRAEMSGVLNWLIQGCLLWQREGLKKDVPAKVRAAVNEYRRDEDALADFLEEHTVSDMHAMTPHADLFKRYETWAEDAGIKFKRTRKQLAKDLRARGWRDMRTGSAKVVWQGVQLLPE